MRLKPYLIEIGWLLLAFVISYTLLNFYIGNATLDINLHDTYFVINAALLTIPVFIVIVFFTFSIKEAFNKYARAFPNIIILISGVLTVTAITWLTRWAVFFDTHAEGWTIYPPLSALLNAQPTIGTSDGSMPDIMLSVQVSIILVLLIVVYKWGSAKRKPTNLVPPSGG